MQCKQTDTHARERARAHTNTHTDESVCGRMEGKWVSISDSLTQKSERIYNFSWCRNFKGKKRKKKTKNKQTKKQKNKKNACFLYKTVARIKQTKQNRKQRQQKSNTCSVCETVARNKQITKHAFLLQECCQGCDNQISVNQQAAELTCSAKQGFRFTPLIWTLSTTRHTQVDKRPPGSTPASHTNSLTLASRGNQRYNRPVNAFE